MMVGESEGAGHPALVPQWSRTFRPAIWMSSAWRKMAPEAESSEAADLPVGGASARIPRPRAEGIHVGSKRIQAPGALWRRKATMRSARGSGRSPRSCSGRRGQAPADLNVARRIPHGTSCSQAEHGAAIRRPAATLRQDARTRSSSPDAAHGTGIRQESTPAPRSLSHA